MSLQNKDAIARAEELGWVAPDALVLTFEHVPQMLDLRDIIRACEGKHTQQAIYSTFHDALTQVCFGCLKVRSTIPRRQPHVCYDDCADGCTS